MERITWATKRDADDNPANASMKVHTFFLIRGY
jgi:hypothetical protein